MVVDMVTDMAIAMERLKNWFYLLRIRIKIQNWRVYCFKIPKQIVLMPVEAVRSI